MLGHRSPWTWALVAALVLPGQGCLLDTGPFSSGATAASGGAGGSGGDGGSGGATATTGASSCGNGVKEAGEACDDGNEIEGDGCFECKLDCGCPGCVAGAPCRDCEAITASVILKDPATKHCYLFVPAHRAHEDARNACKNWGAELVAPSTQAEMNGLIHPDFVAAFKLGAEPRLVWTGGRNSGTWQWQNGEPWKLPSGGGPAWHGGNPDATPDTDCVAMDSAGLIRDRLCSDGFPFMCERAPM